MAQYRPGEAEQILRNLQAKKKHLDESESRLMSRIRQYCKDNGYPAQFFRTSQKLSRYLTPGIPDCIIAIPAGRTLWLELKSKRGKLSSPQKQIQQQLIALGHSWHKVKSYKQFLEIVNA